MTASESSLTPQSLESAATPTPPPSNTGGKLTNLEIGLDWLRVTIPADRRQALVDYLTARHGAPTPTRGRNFFNEALAWETGARVDFTDGNPLCSVDLPGRAMSYFKPEEYPQLLRFLAVDLRGRATRVDARADDASKTLIDLDAVAASFEGREFCRFKVGNVRRDRCPTTGEVLSYSVTVGKHGGDGRMVQFYDKTLESQGETDCNRLEVRWYGDSAAEAFADLVDHAAGGELVTHIGELIGGAAQVREYVEGEQHLARRREVGWWSTLKLHLGAAVLKVQQAKAPLQRFAEYVVGDFSKPLGRLVRVLVDQGHDAAAFLGDVLRHAEARDRRRRPTSALELDLGALVSLMPGRRRA